MSRHMRHRTTVRLDDSLIEAAKVRARMQNRTLTSLIEEGLRNVIAQPVVTEPRKRFVLPMSQVGGGPMPGVDISNNAQLLEIMEEPYCF